MAIKLSVESLSAWYGEKLAIQDITMDIEDRMVTAVIGPSGCGKSTLIRCLNRMHETIPKARVEGKVLLQGEDIYAASPVSVRRRIGMVFQKANPFPTAKIEDLMFDLKKDFTLVVVTHNMQQAARVSETTAFMYLGKLIEVNNTRELFERPREALTESYITGRFG